ncbi:MAG: FtsB family cell division protein [Candidatus Moraniibacteriota bacterium]|jgi:cell division protein FtsL
MSDNFRTAVTVILLIVGVSVIVGTFVLIVNNKKRANVIQNEIISLQEEKKKYEHENTKLQDKIAYLKSEHSYEKEAKKLNYKKQGEHVVVVRRAKNEIINNEGDDELNTEEKIEEHYSIWLQHFF